MELAYRNTLMNLVKIPNIAESMTDADLETLGLDCLALYKADVASRASWETWYAKALKTALQVQEAKNFPWPNCSNIKFPLVTIAALNFHSLAYPALINGREVVKCATFGTKQSDPEVEARASRIQDHMNYQLLEETDWESDTDRGLLVHAILGCHFKKVVRDVSTNNVCSSLVFPEHLVVNYWTKSLKDARIVSEVIDLYTNDYEEMVRRKLYRRIELTRPSDQAVKSAIDAVRSQTQRIEPSASFAGPSPSSPLSTVPIRFIEQYRYLDLDKDGYAEPYCVTFEEGSGRVVRVVANWVPSGVSYATDKRTVVAIEPIQVYTKIPFIPSPDGGFYDIGFGQLLGSLSDSVDSIINQLVDSGTMRNLGGGFLGRGARIRAGQTTFAPGEWKRVDSTGDDLGKSIVPLPTGEPSKVLLELLLFLINYTERVSQSTEGQMGEMPGQNTPAEVMRVADSNGRRIFNAIFKRMWRAFKEEFRLVYTVNARSYAESSEAGRLFGLGPNDYVEGDVQIIPAADSEVVTSAEQERQSILIMQIAKEIPGHNLYEVGKRIYRAHRVRDIEEILPDPKGPNAVPSKPDPKVIKAEADAAISRARVQEIGARVQMDAAELQSSLQQNTATLLKILAEAEKLKAETESQGVNHLISLINAQIGAAKVENDKMVGVASTLLKHVADMEKIDGKRDTKSTGKSVE